MVVAPPVAATSRSPAATAIDFALRQLGEPYQWGGTGPGRWDCSGLVMRAYQRAGVFLPRVSRNQYKAGRHVPIDDLRAGDLVFYAGNPRDPSTIGHVGMYLGGGRMIEAPRRGKPVRIASIWRKSLLPRAVRPSEGRRMLPVRHREHSSAVLAVQQRLAANGDCLAVDGDFGPVTLRTVRRFQARHGLVVDGIVGHRTWAALVSHGRMRSQPSC